MNGVAAPALLLVLVGASAGGLVAWVAAAPSSSPEQALAAVHADGGPLAPDAAVNDEHGDDHDHLEGPDEDDDHTAAGRGVDVWVDEPPLGPLPTGSPPHVDTSEEAVAGYLDAAYTVTAEDADIRHRRHHVWLHDAAPGRTGGVWTDDPPPDGVTRTVEVVDLELHAAADGGAAWRVTYRLWDDTALHAERTRYVATRQDPDGRWLVVTETLELDPVAH